MTCWPYTCSKSPKLSKPITTYTGPRDPEVGRVGWSDGTVWLDAGKTNAREGHRATRLGTIGFQGVPEEGLGLPHRRLPGLPQVAQGPEGPHPLRTRTSPTTRRSSLP